MIELHSWETTTEYKLDIWGTLHKALQLLKFFYRGFTDADVLMHALHRSGAETRERTFHSSAALKA